MAKRKAERSVRVPGKNGRPIAIIDYAQVKKLAGVWCTHAEIASILDVSLSVLEKDDKFRLVYQKAYDAGKQSLRRAQYHSALRGNVTSQIWLGKQMLNQRDKPEDDADNTPITPVRVVIQVEDGRRTADDPPDPMGE